MLALQLSPRQLHHCQHRFTRKLQHRHHTSSNLATVEFELITGPRSGRMKTRGCKYNSVSKMDLFKRRFPNHTEIAYREAVAKLKYLLAESYAPKISLAGAMVMGKPRLQAELTEYAATGDDEAQSVTSEISKKEPTARSISNKYYSSSSSSTKQQQLGVPAAELSSFVERQEEYIEQLEKESEYCREELKGLMDKVREVVAENEALQDNNKTHFFKHSNPAAPTATSYPEAELADSGASSRRLEGPSIVFESRISELEAQLTQARLELRNAREDNQENLARLAAAGPRRDHEPQLQLELERASREKRELEAQLEERQVELARLRSRDAEAQLRSRRAAEAAQQAEYHRAQAELEASRLREELDTRQDKLREALQETNRRLAEEKQQLERRFNRQVEQLTADVAQHWEAASKSQLQADKHKRQIADLERDLAQKQAAIELLNDQLQQNTIKLQEQLSAAIAERDAAQEQLASCKLAAERNERQARQEQARLESEINSYKARLERADADLVHAKREHLHLTEEIAALEKEINMNKIVEETRVGVLPISKPSDKTKEDKDKDKELAALIYDLESKHTSSAKLVADLEDSLSKQASLVSRLTDQCQSLTQRLETNDRQHKEEMASLQSKIEYLSSKIRESLEQGEAPPTELDKANFCQNSTSSELVSDTTSKPAQDSCVVESNRLLHQALQSSTMQLDAENIEEASEIIMDSSTYSSQALDQLEYPTQQQADYTEDYSNQHYNAQYDPAHYYDYFNEQQYTLDPASYPQNQQQQQHAQAQEYSQNQQYTQNEQYLEKEIFKDETYNEQDYQNYSET